MTGASRSRAYKGAVAVALATSFLIVWTTVVRDDGNGVGFFMVILGAAVGSAAAWFRPGGLARTMVGVAIMQVLLGIAVATAPSVANLPGASFRILVSCTVFAMLWLVSAALFRTAARALGELY